MGQTVGGFFDQLVEVFLDDDLHIMHFLHMAQFLPQRHLHQTGNRPWQPAIKPRVSELAHGLGKPQFIDQTIHYGTYLTVMVRPDIIKHLHAVLPWNESNKTRGAIL